ncbi:PREDICTED: lysosomal thioesterase PPT2 homolog [Nicrophorus vespilloides]|uniref:palmitoyl-CoA hydrolase n=1 Tax=Nicrophorus vespilloides TaxID=110193 RepID=A0ABM1NEI9_NICVS|nr:PREDICTED: lysosomal thioesterase PPT2 homolog [Nicrophorus vespilloides]
MHTRIAIALLIAIFCICNGHKPVVLLHGIMTGNESLGLIKGRILEKHPGTVIYNLDRFAGWSSLDNLWFQVNELGKDVMDICKRHPEGVHLLGYSQGALISRVILQTFPQHNVINFISLSGPQAGQYGTSFLHIIFPGLALKGAFELFYSHVGQHTSVGNYWNDPFHQELYFSYSQFLPFVNNEIITNKSETFRVGLLKLNKMVLIGGPDDNVITPWQSSQFGYFGDNDSIVEMANRDIYTKDLIGLKSLDKKKKLDIITVPGINHFMWHLNISIVDNYILKYLN